MPSLKYGKWGDVYSGTVAILSDRLQRQWRTKEVEVIRIEGSNAHVRVTWREDFKGLRIVPRNELARVFRS